MSLVELSASGLLVAWEEEDQSRDGGHGRCANSAEQVSSPQPVPCAHTARYESMLVTLSYFTMKIINGKRGKGSSFAGSNSSLS